MGVGVGVGVDERTTSSGSATAKAILAGEHFVVYGCPAIAAPVPGLRLEATLSARCRGAGAGSPLAGHAAACVATLHERFGGPRPGAVDARIVSSIPIGAGLGSSAALSVALARAWCTLAGRPATDDAIREASLACERLAHGNPSGVDTEVAMTGLAVRFVRGEPPAPVRIGPGIGLVALDTGVASSTGEMVAAVAGRRESDPARFEVLLRRAIDVVRRAETALARGDVRELGRAFAGNQELLADIGVVTPEVERVVRAALDAGAAGAKVTGAGGGGVVIAVLRDEDAAGAAERLRASGVRVVAVGPLRERGS